MKNKKLIALLASIGLILVLVLSGCTPTAEPEVVEKIVKESVTVEVEKQWKVMNPLGEDTAVELEGMQAPRLDTLAGKTIVVNQGEGSPVVMPALQERMKKEFPTSTVIYIDARTFLQQMTEEQQAAADVMIMGNAW